MAISAALLLVAASPAVETLPRGVSIVGTARAEIVHAERATPMIEAGHAQRSVTPERDGVIVNFD